MKKIIFSFVMLMTLTFGLMACTGLPTANMAFVENDEFSIGTIASVNLLTSSIDAGQIVPVAKVTSLDQSNSERISDIDLVAPYLEVFEQLMASDGVINVTVEASDLEGYTTKQTVSTADVLGSQISYVVYFNEVAPSEEESDVEVKIEGILILNDLTYQLMGEIENTEGEQEIKIKAYIDEDNYVQSIYSVEDEEVKIGLRLVVNGVVQQQSQIKIENEDGEYKAVIQVTNGDNEGRYTFKYEEEDGMNKLKISFETTIDGVVNAGVAVIDVLVDEVTGETYYQIHVKSDDDEEYDETYDREEHEDEDENEDEYEEENEQENEQEQEQEQENESVEEEASAE